MINDPFANKHYQIQKSPSKRFESKQSDETFRQAKISKLKCVKYKQRTVVAIINRRPEANAAIFFFNLFVN